jgi:HEAT repeats
MLPPPRAECPRRRQAPPSPPLCSNIEVARLLRLTFLPFLFSLLAAHAELIPVTSTRGLVDSADLIIVGTVERVQQTGAGSITINGENYDRVDFQAEITIDSTLKGEPVARDFILNYSKPSADSVGNVARGGLFANTYEVVFLKRAAGGYRFVTPYTPSLPATSKSCGPNWRVDLGQDAYHGVLQRVLNVLCTKSSPEQKNRALSILNSREDSSVAPFLKAALDLPDIQSDAVARTSILSALVTWKDISVLPAAVNELFAPSKNTPGYLKSNLVLAISSLDPAVSIPLLARALKLPEREARVAAARFLEYTKSQNALDVLFTALDDSDREVQFAVMQSLGNLTNQHEWRPNTVDSDSHWNACIEHWREFEAQHSANKQKCRERKAQTETKHTPD